MRPDQPAGQPDPTGGDVRRGRWERKRDRVRAEIARNRAGGHRVPTWVLAAVLGVVLAGWLYLIVIA